MREAARALGSPAWARRSLRAGAALGQGAHAIIGRRDGFEDFDEPERNEASTSMGTKYVCAISGKEINKNDQSYRGPMSAAMLAAIRKDCPGFHPKDVIFYISEDLLAHYTDKPLIDKYDVYQHLMDYWSEVMQDDAYLIAADGWKAETYRIII